MQALFLIILFFFSFAPTVFAVTDVLNMRYWVSPESVRVVIDTNGETDHTLSKERGRTVLNLHNAKIVANTPKVFDVDTYPVKAIMFKHKWDKSVDVEIILMAQANVNVFKLKPFAGKTNRIVIDIEIPANEKEIKRKQDGVEQKVAKSTSPAKSLSKQSVSAKPQTQISAKPKIIVIDPGHGGEDPGAIGYLGTKEKDLTLDIGKKLHSVLNKRHGYRAYLTRDGDYYISFKRRLDLARKVGADVFISVHIDAAKNRSASGCSVYVLSLQGASSEVAKLLAHNENLADMIGGTNDEEASQESDAIVLSMFQTNTINFSRFLGNKVLSSMGNVTRIKFATVQSAPFRVLKLPDKPSLLVEAGYISNRNEEKKLRTNNFRIKIANALAMAIINSFPTHISANTDVREKQSTTKHKKQ